LPHTQSAKEAKLETWCKDSPGNGQRVVPFRAKKDCKNAHTTCSMGLKGQSKELTQ
jgi:hypothetical protein